MTSPHISIAWTAVMISSFFFLVASWYHTFRETWEFGLTHNASDAFSELIIVPLVDALFSIILTGFVLGTYVVLLREGLVRDRVQVP